jgi:hypothetical protein
VPINITNIKGHDIKPGSKIGEIHGFIHLFIHQI